MALIGAFDRTKHFDELDNPLESNEGVLTPATRRARCLSNLAGSAMTAAQMATIAGVTPGTAAASKALVNDADGEIDLVRANRVGPADIAGTVGAGTVVAEEHGDDFFHYTKLTCTAFVVGTEGDTADLAIGALLYTFPSGYIQVDDASIQGIFDDTEHSTVADGEFGLGTVVGSGAVDTLGEVGATSENIIQGDVGVMTSYVLGTTVAAVADQANLTAPPLVILTGGVHTVYLNVAATWPNVTTASSVTFTGTITLKWRKIS